LVTRHQCVHMDARIFSSLLDGIVLRGQSKEDLKGSLTTVKFCLLQLSEMKGEEEVKQRREFTDKLCRVSN
jgi:hypothetical protein